MEDLDLDEKSVETVKKNIAEEVDRILQIEEEKKRAEEEKKEEEKKGKKKKKNKGRKGPGGNKKGGGGNKANKNKSSEPTRPMTDEEIMMDSLSAFVGRRGDEADHSKDIVVEGVNVAFGSVFLLENAKLTLNWGVRYGLVGRNGSGKTTLMQMINSRDIPVPQHMLVHLCDSEVEPCEMTALECVLSVDTERTKLKELLDIEAHKEVPSLNNMEYINNRLLEIDSDTAEARAGEILSGLGFDSNMQSKQVKDYSGGWRMRISIAQALFLKPDVLLMDEPTNHLDLESCLWLEDYLSKWTKILLVVSHAQDFLNGVCTKIIHLHNQKLEYFGGNYDQFVQTRDELLIQVRHYFIYFTQFFFYLKTVYLLRYIGSKTI